MFGVTEQKIEKWKSKNNVSKMVKALDNKNKAIKIAALKAVATMKGEEIFNKLIFFLSHPDSEIRGYAIEALGSHANARAQDHLQHISESDEDKDVRKKALEAMKKIIAAKELN